MSAALRPMTLLFTRQCRRSVPNSTAWQSRHVCHAVRCCKPLPRRAVTMQNPTEHGSFNCSGVHSCCGVRAVVMLRCAVVMLLCTVAALWGTVMMAVTVENHNMVPCCSDYCIRGLLLMFEFLFRTKMFNLFTNTETVKYIFTSSNQY